MMLRGPFKSQNSKLFVFKNLLRALKPNEERRCVSHLSALMHILHWQHVEETGLSEEQGAITMNSR